MPAHSKNENLYFLAPAQTELMHQSQCYAKHRLGAICKKNKYWTSAFALVYGQEDSFSKYSHDSKNSFSVDG